MTQQQRHVGQFVVQVNGKELPPEVAASLDEAVLEDDLYQPAMFTLRFNDPQTTLLDGDLFRPGNEVKLVASGADGKPASLLVGEIAALEPAFEQHNMVLVVRGYDRSHRLHRGTKTRTFQRQSDGDIAQQIAREAGLRADVDSTGAQHEYVVQDSQSDLEFLRARAARIGFRVLVDDKTLRFRKAEGAPPTAPPQEWGRTLLAFRARLAATDQPNEVQVRGWDPKTKRALVGQATRPAQPSRVDNGRSGGAVAQQAFGAAATVTITNQVVRTQGEATALAQATLDTLGGDYLSAEGTCMGAPALRAGSAVELHGIGKRMSGSYFVAATRHTYTPAEGYLTTFFVNGRRAAGLLNAIDGGPAPHRVDGVVVGLVTNINDPDKLGRVRVRFPWLDDQQESDWARVAAAGAGKGRGLLALPEVDDEVLVAFEHGDMSRPYVLGGLWNGQDAPPSADAVAGGKVQLRTFKTRAGHVIALSDKDGQGMIELTTKGGQRVTLEDKGAGKLTISSGGDVEIAGKGGKLIISPAGVVLMADASLKLQGKLLEAKADAALTIRGLPVNIN